MTVISKSVLKLGVLHCIQRNCNVCIFIIAVQFGYTIPIYTMDSRAEQKTLDPDI